MRAFPLIVLGVVCATPAHAWNKFTAEGNCGFMQSFDGPGSTTVVVLQDKSAFEHDQVVVGVTNENWSIASGDEISDEISITNGNHGFVGKAVATDHGFILLPDYPLFKTFANSVPSSVSITKGDKLIDKLNFTGFWGEFISFESCRRVWEKEKSEKERMRSIENDLPKDPFSK